MKSKYTVFGTAGAEPSKIRTFKNEPEAMSFISSDSNLYQYGDMVLKRRDSNGDEFVWHGSKHVWEAT